MFVPTELYHDTSTPFTLYGFRYESIAHWLVIQGNARKGYPFKHFFKMPIGELPRIVKVSKEILEEGLEAMLPDLKIRSYRYAHSHPILGIGTTKLRLKFGDDENGLNVYGQCINNVLKHRRAIK